MSEGAMPVPQFVRRRMDLVAEAAALMKEARERVSRIEARLDRRAAAAAAQSGQAAPKDR